MSLNRNHNLLWFYPKWRHPCYKKLKCTHTVPVAVAMAYTLMPLGSIPRCGIFLLFLDCTYEHAHLATRGNIAWPKLVQLHVGPWARLPFSQSQYSTLFDVHDTPCWSDKCCNGLELNCFILNRSMIPSCEWRLHLNYSVHLQRCRELISLTPKCSNSASCRVISPVWCN